MIDKSKDGTRILHMLHSLDCNVGDIGTTVRLGDKWRHSLHPPSDGGDFLKLCVCENGNHNIKGEAIVLSTWYGKFKDVPARLIENEHEIRSRQYSGLFDSMKKAYGDKFNEEKNVTVITYERLK